MLAELHGQHLNCVTCTYTSCFTHNCMLECVSMNVHASRILSTISRIAVVFFIFLLPTQLGTYFFFDFSVLSGVRIDYLAPALYLTDIFAATIILLHFRIVSHFFRSWRVNLIITLFLVSAAFALSPWVGLYKVIKVIEWVALARIFWSLAKVARGGDHGVTGISTEYRAYLQSRFFYDILLALCCGALLQTGLAMWQLLEKASIQGPFYWLGERYMTLATPDVAKATLAGHYFLRPYGTFSHPNSLGGFYALIYVIVLLFKPFQMYPRLRVSALTFAMLLIFMSFSKTAIAVFFLINVFMAIESLRKTSCWYCNLSRVFVLLVLAGIFSSTQGDPLNLDKRWFLVESSWTIIRDFVIAGVGPGNYVIAQNSITNPYITYFLQPVHNIGLLFLAETGLVVGGAIIALLYQPVARMVQSRVFLYGFLVIIITGMMDHYWLTLQQNILVSAVLLGMSASTLQRPSKQTKVEAYA